MGPPLALLYTLLSVFPLGAAWMLSSPHRWPRNSTAGAAYMMEAMKVMPYADGQVKDLRLDSKATQLLLSAAVAWPDQVSLENYAHALFTVGTQMYAAEVYSISLLGQPLSVAGRAGLRETLPSTKRNVKVLTHDVLTAWQGNAFLFCPTPAREYGVALGMKGNHPFKFAISTQLILYANKQDKHVHASWFDLATSLVYALDEPVDATITRGIEEDQTNIDDFRAALLQYALACIEKGEKHHGKPISEHIMNIKSRARGARPAARHEALARKWLKGADVPPLNFILPEKERSKGYTLFVEGWILAALQLYDDAVVYLEQAVRSSPENSWFKLELGLAHAYLYETAKAQAIFKDIKSKNLRVLRSYRSRMPTEFLKPLVLRGIEPENLSPELEQYFGNRDSEWISEWKSSIEAYEARHNAAVLELLKGGIKVITNKKHPRFVIASVNGMIGVGNRILTVLSSFLLALLTDRVLLVHWDRQETGSLAELFAFPPGLEWEYTRVLREAAHAGYPNEIELIVNNSRWIEVFHDSERQRSLDALICKDLDQEFPQPLLHYHGNQNIMALLLENTHYTQRVRQLFGSGSPVNQLSRYLLRPSRAVMTAMDSVLRQVKSTLKISDEQADVLPQIHLLGIHTRTGMKGTTRDFDDSAMDVYFDQDQRTHFQPPAAVMNCLDLLLPAARAAAAEKSARVVFFVAGDDAVVRRDMVERIQEECKDQCDVVTQDEVPDRDSLRGVQMGVADMFLLSMAETFIRAGKGASSTFATAVSALSDSATSYYVINCPSRYSRPCTLDPTHAYRINTDAPTLARARLTCLGGAPSFAERMERAGKFTPNCPA